jgi:hypothetical protein
MNPPPFRRLVGFSHFTKEADTADKREAAIKKKARTMMNLEEDKIDMISEALIAIAEDVQQTNARDKERVEEEKAQLAAKRQFQVDMMRASQPQINYNLNIDL